MILTFADIEIDPEKGEIRRQNIPVPTAPRVLALLHLLASNNERLVTKDEIVEKIWGGRVISDAAISTSIKEARQAVGDDGLRQSVIRTIHGQGFRCIAAVKPLPQMADITSHPAEHVEEDGRAWFAGKPSIAVLPFFNLSVHEQPDPFGDGIAAELISALSRLGFISVTSRASSFRFRQQDPDLDTIARTLGVRYCLSGIVEHIGPDLAITIELVRTADGIVIWSDRIISAKDCIHDIRQQVVASVIAALEVQIPVQEAISARLRDPDQLDAWAEYHFGLQRLYRFNSGDNAAAEAHFRNALSKEPGFARAHAGLSFVSFQNAFMSYQDDAENHIGQAVSHAQNSLELDMLDPFGNYCMARAKWMAAELDEADSWLARSLDISPNYAQGHYLRSLVHVMQGNGKTARVGNAHAMALSPLDPLQYAMMATQAMAYINDEKFEDAARWGDRAGRSPGCHYLPLMVAAAAQQLSGNHKKAAYWAKQAATRRPDITVNRFFEAFPYQINEHRRLLTKAFRDVGFSD